MRAKVLAMRAALRARKNHGSKAGSANTAQASLPVATKNSATAPMTPINSHLKTLTRLFGSAVEYQRPASLEFPRKLDVGDHEPEVVLGLKQERDADVAEDEASEDEEEDGCLYIELTR